MWTITGLRSGLTFTRIIIGRPPGSCCGYLADLSSGCVGPSPVTTAVRLESAAARPEPLRNAKASFKSVRLAQQPFEVQGKAAPRQGKDAVFGLGALTRNCGV